jgi:hypothetical protein
VCRGCDRLTDRLGGVHARIHHGPQVGRQQLTLRPARLTTMSLPSIASAQGPAFSPSQWISPTRVGRLVRT